MNQEKIGKFICGLRKEKKMTQQELADKIGVTDRAVSKWENGRGLPDLSLMRPLCAQLGITVNDLLNGERIDETGYRERSEENLLNTIGWADQKIKRTAIIFKIVLGALGAAVLFGAVVMSMFLTDLRRMEQNKPVRFSTWGYEYIPAVDLHEVEAEWAIKTFLVKKGDDEPGHHDGEKTFVSMRVYLTEELERDRKLNVYAWVREGKFYLDGEELKEDSGSMIPYKFTVEKIDGAYAVVDLRAPRDGSDYSQDMKDLFPKRVRADMEKVETDTTSERLGLEVEEAAKLYFHLS